MVREELLGATLFDDEDFLELELETKSESIGSSRSWLPHANSVKAIRVESMILLVIVLPRNVVAKYLMIPCTLASFPTSTLWADTQVCPDSSHGSGTALEFHKVTLKG